MELLALFARQCVPSRPRGALDDQDMQCLPDTALADFLLNYKKLFGREPPLEKRPTVEQLTFFTRKLCRLGWW